jgi:acyl-CoA synthetase (AMP-forming)/AMP-acid ligase II
MRAVLMVTPGVDFFALTFALFKVGAVPVMVDPGMGTRNLKACLAEARPEAFIGIPKAHAARVLLGWARETVRIKITVGNRWFWRGARLQKLIATEANSVMALTKPDDTAAVLFTSGSTGVPKGAVYTHAVFEAQVHALREDYKIEPGERDLSTFPLFALFGPALGMAAVVPDMDASRPITADPRALVAAITDYKTTNIFASPALIERIGVYGEKNNVSLPSVRRVISAGAPAEPRSLRRLRSLLADDAELWPSYGATEALPIARIESRELDETAAETDKGAGVCVGRPLSEIDLRIVRITDSPIRSWKRELEVPPGRIGEICVSGEVVTASYFNRPDSTASAKIRMSDGTFYHRMGDVGYVDDRGRIWFCGRKAHRVVTESKTYFTIPCERIANTVDGVKRSALVGYTTLAGTKPILIIETTSKSVDYEQLRDDVLRQAEEHEVSSGIEDVLFHPGFPMDVRHNAKIFREQLAEWAKEQLA